MTYRTTKDALLLISQSSEYLKQAQEQARSSSSEEWASWASSRLSLFDPSGSFCPRNEVEWEAIREELSREPKNRHKSSGPAVLQSASLSYQCRDCLNIIEVPFVAPEIADEANGYSIPVRVPHRGCTSEPNFM